jgi:MFS family permease
VLGFIRQNAAFLAAGLLLTFTSSFGQTFFISVFSGEIRESFGLSHGDWGTIYAAGTFASAVAMLWAGQATDVFRVRALCLVVLPFFAAACLAMAGAQAGWMLLPVVFALRFAGQGMTSHIATVAMARWFVATRGRALSLASMGFALGEALLPLTFVALLGVIDWRWLWVLAAVLILCVMPVMGRLLTLERTPQSVTEESASDGMDGRHWRRSDVLRHWLFWLMVPALMGPAAFCTAFFFHQVHVAETKGLSHLALVALFPVYTASAVAMTLLSGFLIDRLGTRRLMPLVQVPLVAAFLVLAAAQGTAAMVAGLVLMAATVGANHTVPSAFWAEFYGTRHLGAVRALASAVMVLGTALGPLVTGTLIDRGVPFDAQMVGIAGYFVGAAALAALGVGLAAPALPPRGARVG